MNDSNQDQYLPIREISRLTGINTVTLRAWERRYGLLKPQRTEKGHRLYTQDDLNRIQQVQYWLNKGLAISKVNALVQQIDPAQPIEPLQESFESDSLWEQQILELKQAAMELNRRQLDREIERLFSEYPIELLADHLLLPLLSQFDQVNYPQAAASVFFQAVMKEQIYRMQYRQRQTARGKKCLLVSLNSVESDLYNLLLNYALMVSGFRSEQVAHLEKDNLLYLINQLDVDFVVISGFERIDQILLDQYLNKIDSQSRAVPLLVGVIADYYQQMGHSIQGFSGYQQLMQFMQQEAGHGE
jgi:MerR family transcriptional regulator, light-induced transcriptional regulator